MLRPLALLGSLVLAAAPLHAQVLRSLFSPNAEVGSQFGFSIAAVPDADGDGVDDLVVGAYGESVPPTEDAGRAYLFSGATGALLHTVAYPEAIPGSFYGEEVAGIPDVDEDGRGDFAVGGAGAAYVYSGRTGDLLYTIGPQPGAVFGFARSIAGLPDVTGDGRGDLLVGAYRADHGAAQTGRAFVFSGADGSLVAPLNPPAVMANGYFGRDVAAVPDVDGDGFVDLLVGADNEQDAGLTPGRAHLYSGATRLLLRTLTSPGPQGTGDFARTVAGVDDVDGDGRGDLLIGAPHEDDIHANDGRAYLFSGASGALLRTFISPNAVATGDFGRAAAGVPDVDGDGRMDLLLGAPGERGGGSAAGQAYLFSGATGALLADLLSPTPRNSSTQQGFGYAVAGFPDLNGDGQGDVAVGAPTEFAGPGGPVSGQVHVYSGPVTTRAEGHPDASAALALAAAPNPARGTLRLTYRLDRPGPVRLTLYDLLGRTVAVVVDGTGAAGRGEATLDVARLAPGVYVARLHTEAGVTAVRLAVTR